MINGFAQNQGYLQLTPAYSIDYKSASEGQYAKITRHLEEGILTANVSLGILQQQNKYFLGFEISRNTFGNFTNDTPFYQFENRDITHYTELKKLVNWGLSINGGYYFLQRESFQLGAAVGLGVVYNTRIISGITFYQNENVFSHSEDDRFLNNARRFNLQLSLSLPFKFPINKQYQMRLAPSFDGLLLNASPNNLVNRHFYSLGLDIGIIRNISAD